MASFQAEIDWGMQRKKENKNYCFVSFLHDGLKKIPKKQLKKLKTTIMASFQAKIGWKRLRKRKNKNYRSVPFPPNRLEKIPKK